MFKRSTNSQVDLFKSIGGMLSERKRELLDDPNGWHNIFFKEVVSRIDEGLFEVLYNQGGRPNCSIRVLMGMIILKEGKGWTDEQLFDECRFNTRVMLAMGYSNINEDIPTESTYYKFRQSMVEYNEDHGEDLMKAAFKQITIGQIEQYKVSGKKIRLDSKLINSNIARCTRVQMIIEAVRVCSKDLMVELLTDQLDKESCELLEKLKSQSASNIVYPLNKKEKEELLVGMGKIIKVLLSHGQAAGLTGYQDLKRLYEEQYEEQSEESNEQKPPSASDDKTKISAVCDESEQQTKQENTPRPKAARDISSGSVQSIHDPDAAYRTKGKAENKQTISGYHANISETCTEENEIDLIVDAQVVPANITEDEFLIESIDHIQDVLNPDKDESGQEKNKIEQAITDGGYDSKANRKAMSETTTPEWKLANTKGGKQAYTMKRDENNNLQVWRKKTGEQCAVKFNEKTNKYVIKHDTRGRYMTKDEVENYFLFQQMQETLDEHTHNLRANVESTIHQCFHRLKKRNKILYRGLFKCQIYVLSRVLWTNFRRINDKLVENALGFPNIIIATLRNAYATILHLRKFQGFGRSWQMYA